MRTLEDFLNRLTDMDSGWWPFLYLRPETGLLMDNRILRHTDAPRRRCAPPWHALPGDRISIKILMLAV